MILTDTATTARIFLENAGLEPTLNRLLVVSAIAGSDHAPTAREVYEMVSREHKLNRVTVYRILDRLGEKGIVNRITSGERAQHFCLGGNHSHFHCTGCDEVLCIDNATLRFDGDAIANELPLTINHIDLRMEGLCGKCRGKDCRDD
jgi:Fur family ferric uptake transcriptional regulator